MGADFIVEYVDFRYDTDLEKEKNRWLKRIDDLTEEDGDSIRSYYDEIMIGIGYSDEEFKDHKEDLKEMIHSFFKSLDTREVSWVAHKNDVLFVTGGMSSGDEPSECFHLFEKFNCFRKYFGDLNE